MTFEGNLKNIKGRIREAVYIGKRVRFYSSLGRFRNDVMGILRCDTKYFRCVSSMTTLYVYCYPIVSSNGVRDTEYDNSVVEIGLVKYYTRIMDYIKTPRR